MAMVESIVGCFFPKTTPTLANLDCDRQRVRTAHDAEVGCNGCSSKPGTDLVARGTWVNLADIAWLYNWL